MIYIILPSNYASLWGLIFVNTGVVSLLFMAKIVVGVVSTITLNGEAFGRR
jgi:hypothetical protein